MQMTRDCKQLWTVPRRDLDVTIDIESNTGYWFDKVENFSEKRNTAGFHLDFILAPGSILSAPGHEAD